MAYHMTYHIPQYPSQQPEFAKPISVRDMFASGHGLPQTAYGAGPSQPPLQDPSLMFNNNPALMRTPLQAVGSQGPSPVSQLAAVESQKIWDAQDKALHAQLSHEARNVPVRVLGKHRMICCLCHKETPIRPAKNDGIHCTTCFTRRLSSGQQLVTIERQREYNTKQAAIAAAKARLEALTNGNPTAAQSLAPYEPANKRVKLSPSMPSQSRATQVHTPLPSADLLSTNSTLFSQILLPAAPTLPNSAFHGQILPSAERFVGRGSTASPTPAPKPLTIQEALKRARPKEQESREIQEDEDDFDRMVRHALEKELGKMA